MGRSHPRGEGKAREESLRKLTDLRKPIEAAACRRQSQEVRRGRRWRTRMEASEEWSSTRSWKDAICPLQGRGNRMGGGPPSFAPNPQDDDVQNNPEHDESKERYKAFREKHRLDPEEKKPIVQVCQHGYKRQRGHWSIELFESKRGAIDLTATRSKRKELESQSYRVLAVQFSTEALCHCALPAHCSFSACSIRSARKVLTCAAYHGILVLARLDPSSLGRAIRGKWQLRGK